MLLTCSVGHALVPEGVENFGILNAGKPTAGVGSALTYTNPVWTTDYESLDVIGNAPIFNGNLLTFGGQVTVANKWGDRTGYFFRYDQLLGGTSSVSLKWGHSDWKYIQSSRDSYGLEFNKVWQNEDKGAIYFSIGGYYRLLRQRWDEDWWVPLNSKTKDREGYFTVLLGMKSMLNENSFYTVDMNIRDAWAYYGLDNFAWDLSFYFGGGGLYFKVFGGIRSSATWVGTAYPAQQYVGFGFVSY